MADSLTKAERERLEAEYAVDPDDRRFWGGNKGNRATADEIDRRVMIAYKMILDGHAKPDVVNFLAEHLPVNRRQCYNYYAKAEEEIKKQSNARKADALSEALLSRRILRAQAEDIPTKLAILKDEARLLGLYDQPEGGEGSGGGLAALLDSDELIIIKH